jgi:hypothetical protein
MEGIINFLSSLTGDVIVVVVVVAGPAVIAITNFMER